MLGFFVNPTKRIASESFLTSQHLPVGQAWSIEFYRFFLCLLGVSHSSTVNPPTFILNGPKRCWLSHPLKVVNAFKRLSLSGVQALICEDLWLTFSVMNSKKHVTEDKEWQDQPGSHPTPEQMTYMYNLYDIYIYIHVRHVTFALYLFSSCSPLVDGNSPLQAWVAILLVTTTGEIVFKGILAPTMPTFCYHVRASWVWLFDSQGCFFEHEMDKLFSGKKEFDDLILMLFLKTKGWCKDMRKPKSMYLLFELVPWKHVVLFLHVQLNNADSESTVIFSDDDS